MICPLCGQEVKANEALLLQDDAFGDAVVYHVRAGATLNPIAGAEIKSWCAGAGYKVPWSRNARLRRVEVAKGDAAP